MSGQLRYTLDPSGHGWATMAGHEVGAMDAQRLIEEIYTVLGMDYAGRCGGEARSRWVVQCTAHRSTVVHFDISPLS